MIDGHIHIERGDYTLEWIQQFVDRAVATGIDEIRLLERKRRWRRRKSRQARPTLSADTSTRAKRKSASPTTPTWHATGMPTSLG